MENNFYALHKILFGIYDLKKLLRCKTLLELNYIFKKNPSPFKSKEDQGHNEAYVLKSTNSSPCHIFTKEEAQEIRYM